MPKRDWSSDVCSSDLSSVRELTASAATWTFNPWFNAPSAVCVTQMCDSIPHSSSVPRFAKLPTVEQYSLLPKQPNSSLYAIQAQLPVEFGARTYRVRGHMEA